LTIPRPRTHTLKFWAESEFVLESSLFAEVRGVVIVNRVLSLFETANLTLMGLPELRLAGMDSGNVNVE